MTVSDISPTNTDETTYCYRHATVETGLRCISCNKYICSKCAVRTPVGYRCPDCIRSVQDAFYNVTQTTYILACAVSFALAIPTVYILSKLGLFFIIVLGIPTGGIISEAVFRVMRRQRGRNTWLVVGVSVALGGLVATIASTWPLISPLLNPEFARSGGTASSYLSVIAPALVSPLIVTAICAVTAGARFKYGK